MSAWQARLWPRWRDAAPLWGFLLVTLVFTFPLVAQFTRAIPGDGFDGWQNYWNLWWTKVALLDQHTTPFFTSILYHPTGVGLLFHTLNLFNGLATLPVQVAWGLIPAYNTVVLLSFVLGGYGAFLLTRWTLNSAHHRAAAFAAGVIFTFSPFHLAHLLGHMQVISLQWIPFYALCLLRCVSPRRGSRPRLHDIALAALFLVLVGLCDWYYVLYCALFTVLVLGWVAWGGVRQRIRLRGSSAGRQLPVVTESVGTWRALVAAVAAWFAFLLVMSPVLAPMIREAGRLSFMVPDPGQSRTLSADLAAFVTPQEFHPIWGDWARGRAAVFAATVSEHQVFLGYVTLLLLALAVILKRRPALHPWPLILAAFFVLSLGPVLHINGETRLLPGGREVVLPYGWISGAIPFMEISRSVSRLDVMVMLSTGVLAAGGLSRLSRRQPLVWVVIVLILFEFLPAPYPMSLPDTPGWYRSLAEDTRSGSVLNLPMEFDRPGYLLYQTVHQKPLTVAYISRNDPRTLTERAPVLQLFRHLGPDIVKVDLAAHGRQVLADLDVRWVVLDRYQMPGEPERSFHQAMATQIFGESAATYVDDRLTVYEVTREAGSRLAYPILGTDWGPFDSVAQSRTFAGQATLDVRSSTAGPAELIVSLSPGSQRLRGQAADVAVVPLELVAGTNLITLRAAEPDSVIEVRSLEVRTPAE